MKFKRYFSLTLAGGLLAGVLFHPNHSHGEADATLAIVQDVVTQQKAIADNQAKIDAKIAEIAEELRVARIFVSRAGGRK